MKEAAQRLHEATKPQNHSDDFYFLMIDIPVIHFATQVEIQMVSR